jgi:hypothetical protein
MKKKTVEQIYRLLDKSLVGYEVNGNPTKRKYFLYNIAVMLFRKQNMSNDKE